MPLLLVNLFTVVTLTIVNELFVDLLFCAAISALLVWALKGGEASFDSFPPSNIGGGVYTLVSHVVFFAT